MRASKLLSFSGLAALAGFPQTAASSDNGDEDTGTEVPAGDAAAAAAVDAAGDPDPAAAAAQAGASTPTPAASAPVAGDTVLASDALRLAGEAKAAGFAEANARMSAVFASPEGKADPANAAFLLSHTSADAPGIIAHLKANPSAAAGRTSIGALTPHIDLNGGRPAGTSTDGSGGEDEAALGSRVWGEVQGNGVDANGQRPAGTAGAGTAH
jgi:hypothetical protein